MNYQITDVLVGMPRYKNFYVICHGEKMSDVSRHKLCLISQHILQDDHLHN